MTEQSIVKRRTPSKTHIGKKYGHIYVKNVYVYRRAMCIGVCDCGNEKEYTLMNLILGITKSCGCSTKKTTHGMTNTRLYRIWHGMRLRCHLSSRKSYVKYYQSRGITVCDRWNNSFELFAKDMGEPPSPKHSIDRIDNNKGYYPDNCRWVLSKEQQRNTSRNVYLEYRGEKRCISEWSEITGVKFHIISQRIRRGWSVEDTFNTPVNEKFHRKH